ncbi:MBOAT family O-acyltransferase [Butyrivibrio sp. VCB2001]|uniref:MBOAT family O-acyltransferase n=1 Tax=Butyrivibrio sp. VCB2001 TaxID=1280667 RepID=UPI00041B97AC|nr:MBOAT family O-acyltransferase [Butyrivibrio sp. VCB2001]
MLFNSIDFLIFFPIVLLLLWCVPKKVRLPWMLVCSYFFYMCWEAKYIVLILASTVITYLCAILMEKTSVLRNRKLIMLLCIVSNLGILFFFKYFNFFLDTIGYVSHSVPRHIDVLLPVGISFYTFQALGYTIDCYRGKTKAEHNFITYALFVSFFPQLVAGPIERSGNLLGQLKDLAIKERKDIYRIDNVQQGLIEMCWGMFMKLVIADRVAILVDNVYSNLNLYGSVGLLMAFFGFGLQIYCDFGSYSTIAIGAAKVMGIRLMENFDAPYFATSVTSFWRKWHISLSSWFRDYVYIPLGGNRKGKARKLINVFIVFVLSGLWHGANWTFVFWGAIHGILQIAENIAKPTLHKIEEKLGVNKNSFGFVLCRAAIVTVAVDFAWVFFRADSFSQAYTLIHRLFTKPDWWILSGDTIYSYGLDVNEMWILVAAVLLLTIVDFIRTRKGLTISQWLVGEFAVFRVCFILVVVLATIVFGEYGPGFESQQFIYFQF